MNEGWWLPGAVSAIQIEYALQCEKRKIVALLHRVYRQVERAIVMAR